MKKGLFLIAVITAAACTKTPLPAQPTGSKCPAGHLRHRAHLLLCCFDHWMRIFAFFMLDCLVWFDLGSIPFWSQDRSRIVQNQSKSVQNRSKIGSKSVQNRSKIDLGAVLGGLGASWGGLGVSGSIFDRKTWNFGPPWPPILGPKIDPNRLKIDVKMQAKSVSVFGSILERTWTDLGSQMRGNLAPNPTFFDHCFRCRSRTSS